MMLLYSLLRKLYSALFLVILPLIVIQKLIRSRRNAGYRKGWLQRFGFAPRISQPSIWIHSVSMGETIAMAPLVKKLLAQHHNTPFVITTMTPTGKAQVEQVYAEYIQVQHCYLPYDIGFMMGLFMRRTHAKICVIMETELWPNMLAQCHKRNIPTVLTNARLSQKSANGYAKIAWIMRQMLKHIDRINAQTEADAQRFISLEIDADKVMVTGNLKYDMPKPKVKIIKESQRPIWIAASTHLGEDEIALQAHKILLNTLPNALLIIVPRHPERFDQVANDIATLGFSYARKSIQNYPNDQDQVFLVDAMGELMDWYAYSDVCCVGGSFVAKGGHNYLEPALLSKPILSGTSTFNFRHAVDNLAEADALILVKDTQALSQQLIRLLSDDAECQRMGNAALTVVKNNQGALQKQFTQIEAFLR